MPRETGSAQGGGVELESCSCDAVAIRMSWASLVVAVRTQHPRTMSSVGSHCLGQAPRLLRTALGEAVRPARKEKRRQLNFPGLGRRRPG